jgi:[acyl-carrier-protein] S-malonyltransferase
MNKTAWVFPGQGSQNLGMGADLADVSIAKARLKQARDILGWDVLEVCLDRELELFQTRYAQPCLYVVSTILTDLMKDAGMRPCLVAGHSLGEYMALYAAEVISFEAGLDLVKRRAELMATAPKGIMVALVGFDREHLEQQVSQIPNVVIANDNHNSQIVISGTSKGVNAVLESVKTRRSVPLNVDGAFHSPLMADISLKFGQILQETMFRPSTVPVLSNVDPSPTTDAAVLKSRLMQQMTGQVRWREIIECIVRQGIEQVIEIGPGEVLTNTIARMYPQIKLMNVSSSLELILSC